METSVFTSKTSLPTVEDLKLALSDKFDLWMNIRDFVFEKYPKALEEWNFPGQKYGWSFRIKDKKRAIVYLLPRDGYFKAALVFGGKACEQVYASNVNEAIKSELAAARQYAEGRGISIVVNFASDLEDIKRLIEIKLAN